MEIETQHAREQDHRGCDSPSRQHPAVRRGCHRTSRPITTAWSAPGGGDRRGATSEATANPQTPKSPPTSVTAPPIAPDRLPASAPPAASPRPSRVPTASDAHVRRWRASHCMGPTAPKTPGRARRLSRGQSTPRWGHNSDVRLLHGWARPPPSAPPSGKPIALARTHIVRAAAAFIRPAP